MASNDGVNVLVEADGATGLINLHVRYPDGCWSQKALWESGAMTHPGVSFIGGNQVLVSGRLLAFQEGLEAKHQPVVKIVDLPACLEAETP